MDKIRKSFDSLPTEVKIFVFNGSASFFGVLSEMVASNNFDWRKLIVIPISIVINILSYEALRLKSQG
jgi:hypothetical protein